MKNKLFIILIALCTNSFSQASLIDTTFNPGAGFDADVRALAIQSDGKIIAGGYFTTFNGVSEKYLTRLNSDGSLDATFNSGTGPDGSVRAIAIQLDGKILVGGDFSSYNGSSRKRLLRLNTDGTLDVTFNIGTGFNAGVASIAIQADGKIIVGGEFTTFTGLARNYIARLNSDGTLDTTFYQGTVFNQEVTSIRFQSDGKIIAGGNFLKRTLRLNSDGTLDNSFNSGTGFNGKVWSVEIQTDDKVIAVGTFSLYNGVSRNHICRLNADGTLDATFNPGTGFSSTVFSSAIQTDGKIIVGGAYTTFNSIARKNIIRLNIDGTVDTTFNPGTGFTVPGVQNSYVFSLAIQPDGRILAGGNFTAFDGTGRNRIVRLYNSVLSSIETYDKIDYKSIIDAYPNPNNGLFNVKIPESLCDNKFSITNSMGQTLETNTIKSTILTFDFTNLSNGVYFFQIHTQNGTVSKKIIKN